MKRIITILFLLPLFTRAQDSLWITTDKPGSSFTDGPYELGTVFSVSEEATLLSTRYYASASGSYILHLWSPDGTLLLSHPFTAVVGWNRVNLSSAQYLEAGKEYVVSIYTARAYGSRNNVFATSVTKGILTGLSGRFKAGDVGYPTDIYRNSSYYIDPIVEPIKVFAGNDDTVTLSIDSCGLPAPSVPYTLKSIGPNGLTYEWIEEGDSSFIKSGKEVNVTYNYQGSHLYVLRAKDEAGKIVATTSKIVTVLGNPNDVVGEVLRNGTFRTKGDAILITSPFPIER